MEPYANDRTLGSTGRESLTGQSGKMTYSAPLDGIRAIAILGVLAFHVAPLTVPGGFTGVDVFFTLSGYLITSLILQALAVNKFSFREFYLRRVQRIIPNLVAVVLFVLIAWHILMLPSSAAQAGRHGVWTLLSAANVFVWKYLGNYWGAGAETAPLTHAWSLAIEEQFYLIYPALLVALYRCGRVWLMAGLAGLAAVSAVACGWLTPQSPVTAFYMLPPRGWELLVGGLLAALLHQRSDNELPSPAISRRLHDLIGVAAIAVVVGGYWIIDEKTPFPAWGAAPAALGTAALIWATTAGPLTGRVLSNRLLVGIGKRSYSIYLWHWPLLVLGKHYAEQAELEPKWGALAGGIVSLGLAEAAYHCIENPLRDRGAGRGKRLVMIAVAFAAALGSAAYLGHACAIVADPKGLFEKPTFSAMKYTAGRYVPGMESTVPYYDVEIALPSATSEPPWRAGGVIRLYGGPKPEVVVLGSSHALMYSPLIDDLCRERKLSVAFLGIDQTPAINPRDTNPTFATTGEAMEFDLLRRRKLCEWQPKVVFLIDRWDIRITPRENFRAALEQFVAEIAPYTEKMVFVAQVPVSRLGDAINLREFASAGAAQGRLPRVAIDRKEKQRRAALEAATEVAELFSTFAILRPDQFFYSADGSLRYADGSRFFYADDDHLTDQGAKYVQGVFEEVLNDSAAVR